uniref:Uncharacterized protein n=1 Tax=Marseillevirus LCMAC102 TaxID=2506603 RepID=A0A481YTA6_9VIRU|nr:MAG: hypothetical protein LCMAC102_00240 [Marseillevirus LCMAC102]
MSTITTCSKCTTSFIPNKHYFKLCPTCYQDTTTITFVNPTYKKWFYSTIDHTCDSRKIRDELKYFSCKNVYKDYYLKITYSINHIDSSSSDDEDDIEYLTKVYDLHKEFKNKHLLYGNRINSGDEDARDLLERFYSIEKSNYFIVRTEVGKKSTLVVLDD